MNLLSQQVHLSRARARARASQTLVADLNIPYAATDVRDTDSLCFMEG